MKRLMSLLLLTGLIGAQAGAIETQNTDLLIKAKDAAAKLSFAEIQSLKVKQVLAYLLKFNLEKAVFISSATGASDPGFWSFAVGTSSTVGELFLGGKAFDSVNSLTRNLIDQEILDFEQQFSQVSKNISESTSAIKVQITKEYKVEEMKALIDKNAANKLEMAELLNRKSSVYANVTRFSKIARRTRIVLGTGFVVTLVADSASGLFEVLVGSKYMKESLNNLDSIIEENQAILNAAQSR